MSDGKTERITVRNVPSFVDQLDANIELEGIGTLRVDTAYGGDSFAIVDAEAPGFSLHAGEARELSVLGVRNRPRCHRRSGQDRPFPHGHRRLRPHGHAARSRTEAGGDTFIARPFIDSKFRGRIESSTRVGGVAAVIPSISGQAPITGLHDVLLDPGDPQPGGYRIGDTWPMPGTGSGQDRGRRM